MEGRPPMPDDKLQDLEEFQKLPPREQSVVRYLLQGMTETEACRLAGYAETTIHNGAGQITQRTRIKRAITLALAAAGVTPELLATRMREGLDGETPERTIYTKGGDVMVIPGHANLSIRYKYLAMALKIGGHEPSKDLEYQETYEEQIFRLRGIKRG